MGYSDFLATKAFNKIVAGFNPVGLNENMKPHQNAIVDWSCQRGRSAIFADTGMGKSLMQLEWARQVNWKTGGTVLVLAPLAVGRQTQNEAEKFNVDARVMYSRSLEVGIDVHVANYEILHLLNPAAYSGIVLDESSILKGQSGAYRKMLTEFAKDIPYRLSCTATPSPNDFMELGTQAEFLGIMSQVEMLSMFFTHDGSETQKWRLKGHGAGKFWEWLATWAVVISSPEDLGFDGSEYELPPLNIVECILPVADGNGLFADIAQGLSGAREAKKRSVDDRVKACSDWVNSLDEPCLIWAETNEEGDKLESAINDCVQVAGSHKQEVKEDRLLGFGSGKYKKLVSKAKIAGFGMNWQNACKMAFVGATYSFEQFYQAVRREWRFGQTKPVEVCVYMTEEEVGIHAAMMAKMEQDKVMRKEMIKVMGDAMKKEILGATVEKADYKPTVRAELPCFL